jgi:hypothetical protein
MVEDLTRARDRLTKFMLRHSRVWRGGSNWTHKHQRWLAIQHFEDRALAATYQHYRATVMVRDAALEAVEADLQPWCARDPFGAQVRRLAGGGLERRRRGRVSAPPLRLDAQTMTRAPQS